ncbi:UbiA family prenyltransferase [bacterium]|nr:UbiA family prenyltransferase [bacterium]
MSNPGGSFPRVPGWLDYLFLLRPTLFYPVWTFFLAGHSGGRTTGATDMYTGGPLHLFLAAIPLTLTVGAVFILNQLNDIQTDRINGKLFLVSEGLISRRKALIQAVLLAAAGTAGGFIAGTGFGLLILALLVLSGWCYNYPPASWKDHPIMGIVTNAGAGVLIYSIGWYAGGGDPLLPARAAAYGLAGGAVYLNTTLPDRQGDEASGKITFGVKYGTQKTAAWALILELFMLAVAALTGDRLLLICGGIMLPFFVYSAVTGEEKDVVRATKYSVLALAAGITVLHPLYLIPVVTVFFVSKWYYKRRFDISYPSFRN